MRWPIRNQILIPLLVLQSLVIIGLTLVAVWLSQGRAEKQIFNRLETVTQTIAQSWYPLTPAIREQLKQLSGAELVVLDDNSLETTLPSVDPENLRTQLFQSALASNPPHILNLQQTSYLTQSIERLQSPQREQVFLLYPKTQYDREVYQAIWIPIMTGTFLLLLTAVISLWVSQQIAKRIQRVEQHVAQLAQGQFLTAELPEQNDELTDLLRGVNSMAEAMQSLMMEINASAQQKTLIQLASSIAHHLRNAMTGARISLQLHQRRCGQTNDQALDVALDQLTRSERQVQSLLKLAQGNAHPTQSKSLNDVLTSAIHFLQPQCEHQSILIKKEIPDLPCTIPDSESLLNALINLLTNAFEAAGPEGEIHITASQLDQGIRISIADNGPGIEKEVQETLFQPFVSSKPEGAGIGLTFARQVATALNGELNHNRTNEMTCFTLQFPIPDQGSPS